MKIPCLAAFGIALTTPWVAAQPSTHTVTIDGEVWTITREAEACESRSAAAIARYWEIPAYRIERDVVPDRYFVNGTTDCWIELYVQGVDDSAVIFKVTEDLQVIDARGFSYWGPKTYSYPAGPYPAFEE